MFHKRINDRLELRLLQLNNADELFTLIDANRAYLRVWLPWLDRINSDDDTKKFIDFTLQQFAKNRSSIAGIFYEGSIVGLIGYNQIDRLNRIGFIGYWLAENYQGRGIMTIACRATIDYGFTTLKLNRLVIACATENRPSRSIPERLGFSHEGTAHQAEWLYDRFVNHEIYALLHQDRLSK
jgi:ribosomal-protein-serine acetyltransferase